MTRTLHDQNQILQWINCALDDYGGIIAIDAGGRINYVSPRFAEYLLGVEAEVSVGRLLEEEFPNSGLLQVLATGIPQVGSLWKINGRDLIVSNLPVVDGKNIVGAILVVIFRKLDEALSFAKKLVSADAQLGYYKEQVKRLWGARYSFDSIIGSSLAIMEAKKIAWDVAATHLPVLIAGDTGTGKELFAHAIHQDSHQKDGPFVVINCAAIPDNLVESELFGYDPGAFTGANKGGKLGKFELADQGTIFLDEVGQLPLYVQAKLLRVIQEQEIDRVGSTSRRPINVRIISATNIDLEEMVRKGAFREDLFYRLNVFSVRVPALRDRLEDIVSLSQYFISQFNHDVGTKVTGLSDNALSTLMSYHWPGNVRELKSTIERASLDAKVGFIEAENLFYITNKILTESHRKTELPTYKEALQKVERELIIKAIEEAEGNKSKAIKILKMNRTSFYSKLKELGIS